MANQHSHSILASLSLAPSTNHKMTGPKLFWDPSLAPAPP